MVGSAGDRLASKRKNRIVEELYNATRIINAIEITPVLRGSCRMQGPIEEADFDIQKNMVVSQPERKFGKRSMSRRNRMRAESGTCNVCSAPCSSCMHLNMGSKTGEFSDETCRGTMVSQYSINEGDVSKGRPCDSLQHAASEASNLLSVNSNHDSFSANAESKATVRSCDISDASEDFEMHPKLSSGRAGAEDQLSSKTECVLDKRIFSPKYDDPKGVEGHDDNISSVSRANDADIAVSHDRNVGIKNLSPSSVSVCSLDPEGAGKAPFSVKKEDAGDDFPKLQGLFSHSQSFDKSLTGGSSEVLTKDYQKSEADIEKDNGDPADGTFKCLGQDEQEFKSNKLAELPDIQPSSHPVSGDETDESDIVEHDVKVCDICGDAGREDLLAICSRCSDGAEHTYCMREMLQKIPEGDWLCEECKFSEETENQKQGVDADGKRTNKLSANTQSSCKRQAENLEAAPAAKRQATETSLRSPKSSSPSRAAALSRDSSFKSLDKGKVRPASFGNLSGNDIPENTRSATGPLLQTPKGTLLKSYSFSTLNSKPKVKLVDEVVPQKQKGTREQVPLDAKEGVTRSMSKSMSFKPANLGRSSTSESKFKALSPRFSNVQDLKGLKQVKERNAFERKSLSKLDRSLPGSAMASSAASTPKVDQKLTSRGETMSLSSASNNRDSRVVKSEAKVSTLSKSNSNLALKGSEVPVTPVGATSINGMCSSSVEQKPNLVSPKDEPSSSSSWTAERPLNNVNDIVQDGLPRSLESTTQGEKPNVSRIRPTGSTGSKGVPCQKCKDMGHDVENCPVGSPQVSVIDVPAGKNSREETIKGNKLKAALEAAIPKLPVTYGRTKINDQSDGWCLTSVDLDCERASQEQLADSNKPKNMISVEGTHETLISPRNCSSDSFKQTTNHAKEFTDHSTDAVFSLRVEDPNSNALLRKAAVRDWPGHISAVTPVLAKMSAIPEHEYIWQGGFEVHRGGKLLDICDGIQAHLSSCASPKVPEMVNKFPQKIHLNEVPRLSTWPMTIHESGAKEDNIALYFFAKDHESYERNYKGLVDSMMKNDLALKGNLDGVELLIFPSSQLPENCQRWNMLFFLWGVFRVRKVNCSNNSKNSCMTSLNTVPLDRDVSTDVMSLSQNLFLSKHIDKGSSVCDSFHYIAPAINGPDNICMTTNGDHDNKVPCDEQTSLSSQANSEQHDGFDSSSSSRTTTTVQLSPEMRCPTPPEECKLPVCRQDTELKPALKAIRTVSSNKGDEGSVGSEQMLVDEMKSGRDQVDLERDLNNDGYIDAKSALERYLNFKGYNTQQSYNRAHLDLTETVSQHSSGTSQTMPWKEAFLDGESISKKLKTGFSGTFGCSSSRDRDSFSEGFSSHMNDLAPSSSVKDKKCDDLCDEKVIPEDLGTTERYFFPVGSQNVKDLRLGANSLPWKALPSKDEDQFLGVVPNLELALGAEMKPPNKGMLPFFVGSVDKNKNQDKPPDKLTPKEEEDVSASLSLSLSFPFPEKEQPTVKPVSKTEQLLPERRRHVNTSLLLFGAPFLDK